MTFRKLPRKCLQSERKARRSHSRTYLNCKTVRQLNNIIYFAMQARLYDSTMQEKKHSPPTLAMPWEILLRYIILYLSGLLIEMNTCKSSIRQASSEKSAGLASVHFGCFCLFENIFAANLRCVYCFFIISFVGFVGFAIFFARIAKIFALEWICKRKFMWIMATLGCI